MGTFLAVIIALAIGFIASPVVAFFILKNNPKIAARVFNWLA